MDDLIYNQREIPKEQWRYGFRSSAATGCGWIATYNALRLMNYYAKPEDLIRYYERQLPLIHGNCGTTIPGPALFFTQKGFNVKLTARRAEFDEAAKGSDVGILFYRWRRGLKFGAHFVTVRYTDGRFVGYNTYRNSAGADEYGGSLAEFLKQRHYFGAVLISIRDKRK